DLDTVLGAFDPLGLLEMYGRRRGFVFHSTSEDVGKRERFGRGRFFAFWLRRRRRGTLRRWTRTLRKRFSSVAFHFAQHFFDIAHVTDFREFHESDFQVEPRL